MFSTLSIRYYKGCVIFKPKLHKEYCEIEGCCADPSTLEHHHIVERKTIGTSNDPLNLAVICANHHALTHSGRLRIIGVFPSSGRNGRTLIYVLDNVCNVLGMETAEPYFKAKSKQMKWPGVIEQENYEKTPK